MVEDKRIQASMCNCNIVKYVTQGSFPCIVQLSYSPFLHNTTRIVQVKPNFNYCYVSMPSSALSFCDSQEEQVVIDDEDTTDDDVVRVISLEDIAAHTVAFEVCQTTACYSLGFAVNRSQ
ncbi:hypothetical protein QE152_g25221 [Popillia japonica]|uniref:Uncharacterized protein n=1 Tax=Popillia japonica TaxID=7064 RepID=A0AAW1K1P9_POPJA